MGTGLEMMGRRASWRSAGLVATLLVLAGCSNDPGRIDYAQLARSLIPQGQTGTPATQPPPEPAVVLAQTTDPLILVVPQNGTAPFYLLAVSDNGPYRTYITGARQSMTLRQGVLTATRGLGSDLMASDIDPLLALLRTQRSGQTQRVMQYLDGEDVIRDLVLDCDVIPGPTVTVAAGEVNRSGRRMTEACRADQITFRNTYVVDSAGQVMQSEQWLSPGAGSMTFQVLRP